MAHDLRFALRMILTHRWFSLAVIVTLALGIGLNTMVFTLVNAVLFKPVNIPNGARLVSIHGANVQGTDRYAPLSLPDFEDYRAQSTAFQSFQAASDEGGVLSERGNPPQRYHYLRATSGLFTMLQTNAILGRGFLPSDDQPGAAPVVVLGYGVWKERYGSNPSIIGHQVRVDSKPATIVGVMPKGFRFPTNIDFWMPLVPTPDLAKRDNRGLQAFAILKPGVTLYQARTQLDGIALRLAKQYPVADKDHGTSIMTFQQRYNGGNIRTIFLLMLAAVGFVLLIACADVANMMLSRSIGRQREMSIRTALGASRWRVIRQLLLESLLLSVAGGVLGLGLARLGVYWFDLQTQDVGRPYWIQFTMDYSVFAWFAALCVLSGLLFGIAPALRASRPDLNSVLKDGARSVGSHRGGWLSATLVVFQFALTLVLLTGAGIFVHSLLTSLTVNPSVPARQLTKAWVDLPDDRYKDSDTRLRFYDQLLPRLRAIPGVTHAALTSDPPAMGGRRRQIELEHAPVANPAQRPSITFVALYPGYFDTIHLPLLTGRDFNSTDGTPDHTVAILTREAAAHFWPGQNAIGKRFRLYDDEDKATPQSNPQPNPWITVIGVSANLVQELDESDPKPLLFVPYRQEGWSGMNLVLESETNPVSAMRDAVQSLDQDLPLIDANRLDRVIAHQVWFLNLFGKIFSGFALIALLMASIGIYAVIAYATGSRTQEIGVRMALGAGMRNILLLIMTRGLWQIGAGLALGAAAALPVAHLLTSLPLGIHGTDAGVFLIVALILVSVGIFACWLPARRAATLDPVQAIRYE